MHPNPQNWERVRGLRREKARERERVSPAPNVSVSLLHKQIILLVDRIFSSLLRMERKSREEKKREERERGRERESRKRILH